MSTKSGWHITTTALMLKKTQGTIRYKKSSSKKVTAQIVLLQLTERNELPRCKLRGLDLK